MKSVFWMVLLLSVLALSTATGKTRVKRIVGIRKGSKFFLRMNFKDSILNFTTLFTHAAGFKVAWDVPEGIAFSKKRSTRSLYDDVEFLFDKHGFDGKSCLLSNICQAREYVTQRSGVVARILRLFLSFSGPDNDTSLMDPFGCNDLGNSCPLDFTGVDTLLG